MSSVPDGLFESSIGSIRSKESCHHADFDETRRSENNTFQTASGECAIAATDDQKWGRPPGGLHAPDSAQASSPVGA